MDDGEWAHPSILSLPVLSLKTTFLMRALGQLRYDAINVSFPEANLSADYYANIKKLYPDLYESFVSANLFAKGAPERLAFHASRLVTRALPDGKELRIGITGTASIEGRLVLPVPGAKAIRVSHRGTGSTEEQAGRTDKGDGGNGNGIAQIETAHFVLREPGACLGPVVEELRGKVDLLILLYAGDEASCDALVRRFPQIDVIVRTDPLGRAAGGKILHEVGGVAILTVQNSRGKEIGRARLMRKPDGRWRLAAPPESLYVTKDLPADPAMLALIEEFKGETRKLTFLPPEDAPAIYAGAGRCAQCHGAIHQGWLASAHARAFQTLVDRNQHFNPECLPCHTTGFRRANGFYAATDPGSRFAEADRMSGVQCEVCHGPAMEHVTQQRRLATGAEKWMPEGKFKELKAAARAALPRKAVPAATCLACHTPDHDDHFDYGAKVARINHGAGKAVAKMSGAPGTDLRTHQ
ncbi:MAG: cytochrome c family protein [bacterium]|nr:cytochrome c family protein [bacterium]